VGINISLALLLLSVVGLSSEKTHHISYLFAFLALLLMLAEAVYV
jgi:uncharacterized membrane protein